MSFFRPLLLAACMLLPVFSWADAPLIGDFRLGWKPGVTYEQKLQVSQKVTIPFRGTADANTDLTLNLTPSVSKSGRALNMKVAHFKTLVDMPLPKTNERFDSLTPLEGNREMAKFYEVFSSLPLRARLDGRGQVTALQGLEAIELENPLLSRFLGKEQLAALMQQGWFLSLPAASIGMGGSWPFKLAFPTPLGALKISGDYTLLGSENRGGVPCWKIQLKGSMSSAPTAPVKSAAKLSEADLEMEELLAKLGLAVKKATMDGQIYFNPAEQLIHDSEIATDISIGVANMPLSDKPAEIPISQKLVLELRRKR